MPKAIDITGQRFGKLVAIKKAPNRNGKTYWLCKCDCGNEKEVQTSHLRCGKIKSCGCLGGVSNFNGENFIKEYKNCEICGKTFELKANGRTRKYCYECSPSYPKGESKSKTITALRKAMKKEAVKRLGGKCSICGYDKSLRALEFHHKDPKEKDFGLAAKGHVHGWDTYWKEVQKCILVCSNCHAEIHDDEEE